MTVHFTTATVMVETIDTTTRHLADKLVNKYGSQAHEYISYCMSTFPFDSKLLFYSFAMNGEFEAVGTHVRCLLGAPKMTKTDALPLLLKPFSVLSHPYLFSLPPYSSVFSEAAQASGYG